MFTVAFLWAMLTVGLDAQALVGLPDNSPGASSRANSTTSFPPPPQNCRVGENWTTCKSSTCWEKQCGVTMTKFCTKDCKVGCYCIDGWARNGTRCIPEASCPKAASIFTVRNITQDRSLNLAPTLSMFNQNSSAQECGKNEMWTGCSSSSCFEHRCDTKPSILCTRDCVSGCKCMNGFARIDNICINETQCSTWRTGAGSKGKNGKGRARNATLSPTAAIIRRNLVILFVGPFRQRCEGGDANSKCLVTKSVPATQFSSNVESISGFDFEPGFDYKLRVLSFQIPGQKKFNYTLASIDSKTTAPKRTLAPSSSSSTSISISTATSAVTSTIATSDCAEVMCMVFCDYGYKRNAQGCEICSCQPAPTVTKICPDVTCDNLCPSGYQRNAAGCATCSCAPLGSVAAIAPITTTLIPPIAYNCNSAADWNFAKVAACCNPPPPLTTAAGSLCATGFQNGFVSLPVN